MDSENRQLPFSEADCVGPGDRPRPQWEAPMYEWRIFANPTIKEWIDAMSGGVVRALLLAPKPADGVIYATACDPSAPKAHRLTISADHRTAAWSLYTPLLPFNFPRVGDKYKAVFQCRPETYGETKVLVIEVNTHRIEKIDKETQEQAAATVQKDPQQ